MIKCMVLNELCFAVNVIFLLSLLLRRQIRLERGKRNEKKYNKEGKETCDYEIVTCPGPPRQIEQAVLNKKSLGLGLEMGER